MATDKGRDETARGERENHIQHPSQNLIHVVNLVGNHDCAARKTQFIRMRLKYSDQARTVRKDIMEQRRWVERRSEPLIQDMVHLGSSNTTSDFVQPCLHGKLSYVLPAESFGIPN